MGGLERSWFIWSLGLMARHTQAKRNKKLTNFILRRGTGNKIIERNVFSFFHRFFEVYLRLWFFGTQIEGQSLIGRKEPINKKK